MKVRDYRIGSVSPEYAGYARRAALVVSVETRHRDHKVVTTDHREVTGITQLSISGGVWNGNHSDFTACGQVRDALDNMAAYAPGWDAAKVRRLAEIWDRWHLNDMRAACVHQSREYHGTCHATGYQWGTAWLAEEVPQSVLEELAAMFA